MKEKIAKLLIKGTIKAPLGVAVAGCVLKIKRDQDTIKSLKEANEQLCSTLESQNKVIHDFNKLMGREVDPE